MKNLTIFCLFIVAPLIALLLALQYGGVSNELFGFLLLFYALVYHPTIAGLRLIAVGKIRRNPFWLNFIPFWNRKYCKALFFSA
jgi:hypothetical protein